MSATGKKVLVVGDPNSIFVRDFAKQFTSNGAIVDLLSTAALASERLPFIHKQIDCGTDRSNSLSKFTRMPALMLRLFAAALKIENDYDAIVIHFIYYPLFIISWLLRRKTKRLSGVIWGSDFYRSTKMQDSLRRLIYRYCDAIIFTNPQTRTQFIEKFPCAKTKELLICRFGLPALSEIDSSIALGRSGREFRHQFSLPIDKLIVLAGYSGSLAHRQLDVIDQLSQLKAELRAKIHLVFPVGYGNASVGGAIEKKLKEIDWAEYTILTEFYNYKDVARLRLCTDILINVQPTDQFSGSMQETLYAGATIVAGAWLPYSDLIAAGCRIVVVDRLDEIGQLFRELLTDYSPPFPSQIEAAKRLVKSLSSWDANIPAWSNAIFVPPQGSSE